MSVQQRQGSDCAVAAVANVLGLSYNRVRKTLGRVGKGLESHEVCWLLSELGADWRRTDVRKPYPMTRFLELRPKGRYVVSLWSDVCTGDRHAIAVVDGVIHGWYAESWPVVEYWKIG